MKKTFSRAFSLLLVLALLVSVIPSALADEGEGDTDPTPTEPVIVVTATATPTEIEVGASSTLSATVTKDGQSVADADVTWTLKSGGAFVNYTNGATSLTGKAAGTATFTASYTDENGDSYTDDCSVEVTDSTAVEPNGIELDKNTATVGLENAVDLTATIKPVGATGTVQWAITQSSTDGVVTLSATQGNSIQVTGKKDGTATVTASIDGTSFSASCALTVGKITITPTAPPVGTLYVGGKTDALTLGGLPTDKADYTVTWAVKSGDDKVSVTADGVVTALKAGPATLQATVGLTETGEVKYNLTRTEIEVPVTVKNSGVVADNISVVAGGTETITLKVSDESATNVVYSITNSVKDLNPTINSNKITVSPDKDIEDEYTIHVTATYDTASKKGVVATGSVKVYVYRTDNEIYMTVTGSFASGSLTNVTSISKNNGKEHTNVTLNGMLQQSGAVEVKIGTSKGDKIGDFKEDHWILGADSVSFSVLTTGERYFSYELLTSTGLTVSKGYINIKAVSTSADVEFSTTYNKSITFDSSKFTTFWNNNKKANDFTSSLSYVTFDVSGGVYPQYGKLTYNNNTFSYATKFYTSSSQTYYLGKVTYVPDSTLKSSYYVTIPFTAYGTKTSEKMSGTVKIALNESDFLISSNGVQFGLGTTSVVDLMKEAYKAATGAELAYATFPNLSVSTGKLYYNYSTVLNNTPVVSSYEFYVKPTTSQKDLDKVVLVPRAGLTGKISFSFYGYDSQGDNKKLCTIELEVQELTKSEEFTDVGTSYSWAAASVEFLAAQGVAQGSNGKYRPSAYITRGDFMLMLYRAFLEDEHKNDSITSNFSDVVKGSDTYSKETYQAVGVAKKLGIAKGTNGKFNPKSYITRQEAMTLIYRTLDEVNYDLEYTVSTSTSSFKDYSSVASYAKTAISDLIGHGIVIGNNSKINPTSNITRAEMAVILHRVLTY